MKIIRNYLFLLALFCLVPAISGKSPRELITFIQLTDIQMGMISKNANHEDEIRLYKAAIQEVNKIKPDFVVITGDFVNNRTDTAQIRAFRELTALINKKIPVYVIPGNHDVGQKPDQATLDFYFRYYPTDKFSFTQKGIQFTGINSSLINSGTEEEMLQFNWLKQQLKRRSASKIIFSHHPFFIRDIHEKDSYANIPFVKRREYMELFKSNGVAVIFAGHYHNNAEAEYDGIQMITTSAVGKQLGNAKSGFRLVTVFKDSIAHKYVELLTD
jgi:serine/threonine-protein phosphatase CPPED1